MDEPTEERLKFALAAVAGALFTAVTLKQDLERLVRLACAVIPRCTGGSVAMLVEGEPTSMAVSDSAALEVDLVQYDAGEGPCVTALGGQVVRVAFLPIDE